jgi:glycerol-3-phosphate dehydrogenase
MWLYDAMALFRNTRVHRPLSARALASMEPGLLRTGLAGGGLFFDCVTDDARLTLANIMDAEALGASALNYAQLTAVHTSGGRVQGAAVTDVLSGREVDVRARAIVNASGPWSDEVAKLADAEVGGRLRLTKGVHITVPRSRLGHVRAVVLRAPQDGRVFFVVPWGALSLVGTTDTDYEGAPEDVRAERSDVEYLVKAAAHYFPDSELKAADVVAAYAGLRPLVRSDGVAPSQVSREHALFVGPSGFTTVVGGKLTTYRRMASQIVTEAAFGAGLPSRASTTHRRQLPGGRAVPAQATAAAGAIARRWGVPEDVADALYALHGSDVARVLGDALPAHRERVHPELPFLRASLRHAFRHEHAVRLEDALVRRVPLAARLKDMGASVAEEASKMVVGLAGWDERERASEVEAYIGRCAREMAWKGAG